jgi:hypothetical protein
VFRDIIKVMATFHAYCEHAIWIMVCPLLCHKGCMVVNHSSLMYVFPPKVLQERRTFSKFEFKCETQILLLSFVGCLLGFVGVFVCVLTHSRDEATA